MQRRYDMVLMINGRKLDAVVIDGHYQLKHANSMNDELIMGMVKALDGQTYLHEFVTIAGWEIYTLDPLVFNGKMYRLVWCIHAKETHVGIINAFRRK